MTVNKTLSYRSITKGKVLIKQMCIDVVTKRIRVVVFINNLGLRVRLDVLYTLLYQHRKVYIKYVISIDITVLMSYKFSKSLETYFSLEPVIQNFIADILVIKSFSRRRGMVSHL